MKEDDELLRRLRDHEDDFTERKPQSVSRSEIRQTLSAFANSLNEGATAVLFIGLEDKNGELIGVDNTDELQKRVHRAAEQECFPPITCLTYRVLKPSDKAILAVVIYASNNRPHFTGPAFVRRGSQSLAASELMFKELIASQNEKTGRILRMRGKIVSLRSEGRRIIHPISVPNCVEKGEGKVENCDAFSVRLTILSGGFPIMERDESLDIVDICFDAQERREMLIIRGRN